MAQCRLQGSVTQKINLGTLREVPVPFPPLHEQQAIAKVLAALDDKIRSERTNDFVTVAQHCSSDICANAIAWTLRDSGGSLPPSWTKVAGDC